jgi:hypothetical protein
MPVSTREERRQQRKLDRQAAQQRAARNAALRQYGVVGGIAVIVIALAIAIVMLSRQSFGGAAPVQQATGERHFDDPKTASGQLYTHIAETTPITADPAGHYPPVFGDHYPIWRPPGVYDSPIPEGYFIHDLEHGGIVVLYNCADECPSEVNQLRGMLTSLPRSQAFNQVKLVVSPNSKIDHRFALLAWDYEKDLDAFDADAVRAFYTAHLDRGPEKSAL